MAMVSHKLRHVETKMKLFCFSLSIQNINGSHCQFFGKTIVGIG